MALELSPGEFKTALTSIVEEDVDKLRIAIFPVWYEKGKKGESFEKFLGRLGLGIDKAPKAKHKPAKPTKEEIGKIYERAEAIREKLNRGRR